MTVSHPSLGTPFARLVSDRYTSGENRIRSKSSISYNRLWAIILASGDSLDIWQTGGGVDAFVAEVEHALAGLWIHISMLESASRLWFGNEHTACISEASRVGLNCGTVRNRALDTAD